MRSVRISMVFASLPIALGQSLFVKTEIIRCPFFLCKKCQVYLVFYHK